MKLRGHEFAARRAVLARETGIVLFCGQDEAGAETAAAEFAAALPDPGERVELTGADLRADPSRLGDEARSTSLFGDARHIWVRAVGDEAHAALETLIATAEAGAGAACPVIVVAVNATDKSRTAKLLEKRRDAAVVQFYPPDLAGVARQVRQMGDAAGVRIDGPLAERIARGALLDVRLARSEIDKFALYLDASPQSPRPLTPGDLDAIGAGCEEDGFAELVNTVLSGEGARLGEELGRLRRLELNPVGTLLAFERRVALLARLSALLGGRRLADLAPGEKARAGVFWKEERALVRQLGIWHGARLERLIARLIETHRALMTNSQAAATLLAHELLTIAQVAIRAGR